MKFGLSEKNWQIIEDIVLTPIKSQDAKIFIFGSRARSDASEFSDLDLLIEPIRPISTKLLAKIKGQLEDSNLPIKVDLVELQDLPTSYILAVTKDRREL
jgi:predicted nucleotidyltransferase